jgi:hypothetical protein
LNVIEDLADEPWIGDIGNDTKLSTAEEAECNVDSEHTLQWSVTRRCAQVSGAMGISMLSVGGCADLFCRVAGAAVVSLCFRRCPALACVGTIALRMGELGAKTPW